MTNNLETVALQTGIISPSELAESIEQARQQHVSLFDLVIGEKKYSEDALAEGFTQWLKLPRVRLASVTLEPEAAKAITEELALKHLCLPLKIEGRTLVLAMADPADYDAVQDVQFASGYSVRPVVATRVEILDGIQEVYATEDRMQDFLANVADAADFRILSQQAEKLDLDNMDSRNAAELAPVIKMVNLVLQEAIKAHASDIHMEPGLNSLNVRFRVDGVLREYTDLPKWLNHPLVSRLKILAELDIAERRLPQDGRVRVQFQGKPIDIRVSTLPTHFGEKVVLRILGSSTIPDMKSLGISTSQLSALEHALDQPQGLVLVTGPTGSGKSTSLYSMLVKRQSPKVNIVTVEDPIEYQLPAINQVQVNVRAGLTFAGCLRSILRQDPDVILVGEIRDLETAEITFQAAMTGHLVLSTLHTNSSLSAITRLLDLGVDPFLIASSVNLIVAQRLARCICVQCKEQYSPPNPLLEKLRIEKGDYVFQRGRGCAACGKTGYAGRVGIFETLRMTATLKELIRRKASEAELRKAASAAGTRFLLEEALAKVREGVTDLEELVRVIELQPDEIIHCPRCNSFIHMDFRSCPYCMHLLRNACEFCGQELKPEWKLCPYCSRSMRQESDTEDMQKMLGEGSSVQSRFPGQLSATDKTPRMLGQGSALPQRSDGEDPATPGQPELPPAAKKPRILIVDDDEGIKRVIGKALKMLPLETDIVTAADGIEALEKIEQHPVDLVIVDVMMPRMDGLGVCRRLREDIRTAFVPVMMLTASPDESIRTKGYLVGTDDYVSKPFSTSDLNARVMRLLRRTYGL
jgi:type IV pilus assembly protein PilB